MKFGMPSMLSLPTLNDQAALCTDLGLDFVELNMSDPRNQSDLLKQKPLPRAGKIEYTLHIDEMLDPFNFNHYIREAYRQVLREAVRYAAGEGIKVLNMHIPMGVTFTMPTGIIMIYDQEKELFLDHVKSFRDEFGPMTDQAGLCLCFENTTFNRLKGIRDVLRCLLECPSFGLTYDAGHDFNEKYLAQDFYRENIQRLRHMHLHDVIDRQDHKALSDEGGVDKVHLLQVANEQNCTVLLETKTPEGLVRSVNWLRERNYLG